MHFTATDAATAAVILDSVVTSFVGWRLTKVAKRETLQAAENVKPAIQQELSRAVATLIPVVVAKVGEILTARPQAAEKPPASVSGQGADQSAPTPAALRAVNGENEGE